MSTCLMSDADFARAYPSVGARASVLAATLNTVSQDLLTLVQTELTTNAEALRVSEMAKGLRDRLNVIVTVCLTEADRLTGAKVVGAISPDEPWGSAR